MLITRLSQNRLISPSYRSTLGSEIVCLHCKADSFNDAVSLCFLLFVFYFLKPKKIRTILVFLGQTQVSNGLLEY